MKKALALIGAVALAGTTAMTALAGPDNDQLFIDGVSIVTDVSAPEGSPFDKLYSGWRYRSDETQALQIDDFENPAFAAVDDGLELWQTAAGTSGKSCADCHGDIGAFKGLRAGMPKWNAAAGKPWALEHWINWSIAEHQGGEKWKWESKQMLAMTALIASVSRGMPVSVQIGGPMAAAFETGKELYYTRVGQLDMACSNCHEDNAGKMIRADHLSQGQINGFPTYRFKWQGIGSIHRRFKGCMKNIRATPFKPGGDEFTALELYVAWRGTGLGVEGPAVRN
jgi:sulfur-oxidizing protein SoxA